MGSRQVSIRRATSAGYRLPDRSAAGVESRSTVSLNKTYPGVRQNPPLDTKDKEKQIWGGNVRQDQIWREHVESEKRGEKRWEENWGFLIEYDSQGNEKVPEILPEEAHMFSEKMPNTTNQYIGSRLNTELGKSLVHMDFLLTGGKRKKKLGSELLPC
ncbi:Hypothetical predicted protein [Pelobates cultripes]|uniref:Uncharacterized protein n=1 Tax=Pelobates cultripes TaxID=61616 RepID=A0AAD1RA72_PELCU|nr:Hypothetical predicted protein [Pelobates cultripes]